jgi:hypothetical protein
MAKIILVAGTANTGKTKSIRLFLENLGVFHEKRNGDLVLVIPPLALGKKRILGIATGGDNLNVVSKSLTFIDQHNWDVIVCASKSQGVTLGYVQRFAASRKAQLVIISTKRVKPGAVSAALESTAAKISQSL